MLEWSCDDQVRFMDERVLASMKNIRLERRQDYRLNRGIICIDTRILDLQVELGFISDRSYVTCFTCNLDSVRG